MRKDIPKVKQFNRPQMAIAFFGLFTSLGGLATFLLVMSASSDEKNAIFLSYSLNRIALGAGIGLVTLVFALAGIKSMTSQSWAVQIWEHLFKDQKARNRFFGGALILLLISWVGFFLLSQQLPGYLSGYITNFHPVFGWTTSVAIAGMVILFFSTDVHNSIIFSRKLISATACAFVMFLSIFIIIGSTGMGVRYPEDYWFGAGVPLLTFQLVVTFAIGSIVLWIESNRLLEFTTKHELLIALGLWATAALVWGNEPLLPTFFLPDTSNNLIFPHSDSATFDLGGQFALIGQGLFNGHYFDRALYSAFLVYLHAFSGNDTDQLMAMQAVIFAVFPVIIYLIGKELNYRAQGIMAALIAIIRGTNSIAGSTWIDIAGPKTMSTDFPAAIGIALFTLLFLKWMKTPGKASCLIWAGCALGLTIMLRTNALLLLFAALLVAYIKLHSKKRLWLVTTGLLIIGMVTTSLPWEIRNQKNGIPPLYTYYFRIQEVLRARYGIQDSPDVTPTPTRNSSLLTRARLVDPITLSNQPCTSRLCKIGNHFFHNIVTSILVIPTSFQLDNLRYTVKEAAPYWQQNWTGESVTLTQYGLILLNLILISLGIGALWNKFGLGGIFPLVVFFTYILSNSLAFTSGGRYIAPIDWIITFYYAAGIIQFISWMMRLAGVIPAESFSEVSSIRKDSFSIAIKPKEVFVNIAIVFLIASLIPFTDLLFPRRYQNSAPEDVITLLEDKGLLEEANLSSKDIQEFLTNPQAKILLGRALYPRTYPAGKGEPGLDYPYLALDFPRLVFQLIGPANEGFSWDQIILPMEKPKRIPNASDVVVLGCQNQLHTDALAVFVISEPHESYFRSPGFSLTCP
jgi:hypothetical protein